MAPKWFFISCATEVVIKPKEESFCWCENLISSLKSRIISIINSICSFFDMLGVAKGRTDLNFYNTIVRIVITIPIVCITSLFSIEIVAYGQLVATFLQSIIFWMIVVNHTYLISFIYYFSYFSKWLFIQLGCFAVIMPFMNIEHSLILNLCIKAILYIVIVAVSLFCFMRNDIAYFRKIIKRRK